ncbi:hypothetical protein BASA50_001817 [Batrachochytrium salamandrivorans]|uniref:Cytochrome P450 n=1 Tax=Batrachochytrium salamandrivorans TaxID=1357716 RepID=A0ABQ8FN77_9FUNG|nr:hypothetical protein BASA62_009077 [Batrachochytrium salamandrivorans]KAH6583159.1 hypothetical protein BASA61_008129 [Batrachochytrium salamandrivorans]KAH6585094.1 hypothetical protein BASA60_000689 [Batrachochytrium salamandrivorans]KAH6601139.1 hypothetical protein BASA50_001817 [Batrachochytrium salamandrivorans]KAH9275002.1 hypothetical protein BASA83_002715 [Batrachochytrium salamandrivorans]
MDSPVIVAATLVVGLAVVTYAQNYFVGLPGPFAYPLVGNGMEFADYTNKGKYQDYLNKLRKYGRIIKINVFGENFVVTTDAALTKRILTSVTEFWRDSSFADISHSLLDNSLFTLATGEIWKRHRKNLQPAFAPAHLRRAADITQNCVADLINYYKNEAAKNNKSVVVDVYHEFTALSLDIIGKVIFSYDFNACDDLHTRKTQVGQGMIEELVLLIHRRFTLPPFLWGAAGMASSSPNVLKVRNYLHTLIRGVIDKKKGDINTSVEKNLKEMDVLDRLLKHSSVESENFTDQEVVGEVIGFFIAGHETTANTLVAVVLNVCQSPNVMKKVIQEISEVKRLNQGVITMESLPALKYLDDVIRESQRLHPVVATLYRTSLKSVQHEEYTIPANTPMIINIEGVQRDPKYWPNPNKFDPDRWKDGFVPVPGSFLPFGEGPMACIGQKMAMIEIKLAFLALVSAFDMELVPNQDLIFVTSITTGLKRGLKIKLTPKVQNSV